MISELAEGDPSFGTTVPRGPGDPTSGGRGLFWSLSGKVLSVSRVKVAELAAWRARVEAASYCPAPVWRGRACGAGAWWWCCRGGG